VQSPPLCRAVRSSWEGKLSQKTSVGSSYASLLLTLLSNQQVATSFGACPYLYERKFRTNGLIDHPEN
jgi:hypothetical protein